MMTLARGPVGRVLSVILAVWFSFVAMQPATAEPCPHHEPALALLAMRMRHGNGQMAHDMMGHAGHQAPAGSHNDSRQDSHNGLRRHGAPESGHQHHGCTCLGACSASVVVAIVPTQIVAAPIPAIVAVEVDGPTARIFPRLPTPHFLPFANGPPVRAI